MSTMMIEVRGLTFSYGKRKTKIFDDFSLNLDKGAVYGLLGKNGTGKSTLLYLLSGLLRPQAGKIYYKGLDVSLRYPLTLQDMFLVPEEFSFPDISLKQYVKVNAPFYPRFSREILTACLRDFDMSEDIHLGELSLAEGTRYLLLPLFDLPEAFSRSLLSVGRIRMNWAGNMLEALESLNGVLFGLAHYSIFIFGGSYWYKHAFLKTLAAQVVVSLAGLLLIGRAILWIGKVNFERLGEWVEANFTWISSIPLEGVLGVMATVQILFILFLWWLSYRLFIRTQVVKPKFRLL